MPSSNEQQLQLIDKLSLCALYCLNRRCGLDFSFNAVAVACETERVITAHTIDYQTVLALDVANSLTLLTNLGFAQARDENSTCEFPTWQVKLRGFALGNVILDEFSERMGGSSGYTRLLFGIMLENIQREEKEKEEKEEEENSLNRIYEQRVKLICVSNNNA